MESLEKTEAVENKYYNFLINASNQANLAGTDNASPVQANAVLVFISPYMIDKLTFEGLDINLQVDQKGTAWVSNQPFKTIEVEPGVNILGILKSEEG